MGLTVLTAQQDAAGQYKLSGVDVLYTFVTRAADTLTVTDAYGLGITQVVSIIPAAVPFTTKAMKLTDTALGSVGINLNVTLNEDGSGAIAEGSFYPDVNTITDENGNCVTIQQVLPVTDEFTYTSMGNMMENVGMVHPGVNVLGLPGISTRAGELMGGFSISSSQTFEDFPMIPTHPTLCDPTGTDCFPFTVGDLDQDGIVQVYPEINALGIPEYVPGGVPLTGVTAGYFLKRGLNATDLTSLFAGDTNADGVIDVDEGNTTPDFILEWHGVDGADADLGWGDDETVDEDGDGTWFDRTIGIPGITATYMDPACGFTLPIYGDVTAAFEAAGLGACVDHVDAAASGYLMDPSGALAGWGNFLTANAATYAGTAATLTASGTDLMVACGATGAPTDTDAATCLTACAGDSDCNTGCVSTCATAAVGAYIAGDATLSAMLVDDSDHDFDPATGTGRLTMNFDIPCVGIIEAREVIAEFVAMGENAGCMEANACNYDESADTPGYTCVYGSNDVLAEGSPSGNQSPCYTEGECDYGCDVLSTEKFIMTDRYSLDSIYPNPFNPNTTIAFTMPVAGYVELKVYDIIGRELVSLKDEYTLAGTHSVSWNASSYPSGVYIVKMDSGKFSKIQKIVLMK
jgi:hypothetical protein